MKTYSVKLKMSFQTGKNVWGKTNRNTEKNYLQTNSKVEFQKGFGNNQVGQGGNTLNFGPFGSRNMFGSNSGSTSLQSEGSQRKSSRTLGNCSSDSSCSSSTPATFSYKIYLLL